VSGEANEHPADRLLSNEKIAYGELFQQHVLAQYQLYVESAQKVSEKRISTGNYLLTVSSSLMTVFGIASSQQVAGRWLAIIPVAGLLVSLTWFSLIKAYKDLNTAKFKVIHELENYLPMALFRYEWHSCELGKGKTYKPITHLERWIPLIFAGVYVVLTIYAFVPRTREEKTVTPVAVTGTVDVNVKQPVPPPMPQEAAAKTKGGPKGIESHSVKTK
jgi:hypothetical protein